MVPKNREEPGRPILINIGGGRVPKRTEMEPGRCQREQKGSKMEPKRLVKVKCEAWQNTLWAGVQQGSIPGLEIQKNQGSVKSEWTSEKGSARHDQWVGRLPANIFVFNLTSPS